MAEVTGEMLAAKLGSIFPHLDKRQRRLLMGAEARVLGHGGIRVVARAAGVREATVSQGAAELDRGAEPLGRVRREGGGRKRLADLDPGLRPALLALAEPDERGDPMSPLRWTTRSLRVLSAELARQGHRADPDTLADLLHEEGFSLQGNAKTIEGNQVPDRDAQFRYLNEQAREHRDAGEPVVSVDTKKKELVGNYRNGGREWRPAGDPVLVRDHDFPDQELGKAIPYGIYDLAANTGWVNVGTDHDTAAFAVESIRRWWNDAGRADYPDARRLLITADSGGSNSSRGRAWKLELAALALETGLAVTVCHFPPGTSKWNKFEHRLFAHRPLPGPARGRPAHRPRRSGHPPACRRPPGSAEPRRESPAHHHAAAPGSTPDRPGRAVRGLHRNHRHSRTAAQAATRRSRPHHRTRHSPTQHNRRSNRILRISRHNAHTQDQTSALIIDKPLACG